ncbi:MAG: GIY-YIG nuclease family protein [Bacteroidales bacterium]|nr:GIY-YIG nuclease family protein [Bacteroidales bacterium]
MGTKYAVIDVETTGMSAHSERLTEIAIIIHNGQEVVDRFCTLINPERKIPFRITQITGINNRMVEHAPKFHEIARKIIEITDGCVFVAHNVSFDYNFIRSEFAQFGYDFKREKLCTVKLSRKLIPGRPSYSLGNLTNDLNIPHTAKHRAEGDAQATVHLLDILLKIDSNLSEINLQGLNSGLKPEIIRSIPELAGVYFFHNDKGDIIYVGKSKNIHSRVISHFNNNRSKKALEMKLEIADISYEICGSELISLLLESHEIKTRLPKYNRAQRRTSFQYGIYEYPDEKGYLNLKISKADTDLAPITSFSTKKSASEFLHRLVEDYTLCQKLCGLYKTDHACFHYTIKQCDGACIEIETRESYNHRVLSALSRFDYEKQSFLIIDQGRTEDEKSIVVVRKGIYQGFGFIANDLLDQSVEDISDYIKSYPDNRDIKQIIRSHLKNQSVIKVLDL